MFGPGFDSLQLHLKPALKSSGCLKQAAAFF